MESSVAVVVAVVGVLAVVGAGQAAQVGVSDLQTVGRRIRDGVVARVGERQAAEARAWAAKMDDRGAWADIDYASTNRERWGPIAPSPSRRPSSGARSGPSCGGWRCSSTCGSS